MLYYYHEFLYKQYNFEYNYVENTYQLAHVQTQIEEHAYQQVEIYHEDQILLVLNNLNLQQLLVNYHQVLYRLTTTFNPFTFCWY